MSKVGKRGKSMMIFGDLTFEDFGDFTWVLGCPSSKMQVLMSTDRFALSSRLHVHDGCFDERKRKK